LGEQLGVHDEKSCKGEEQGAEGDGVFHGVCFLVVCLFGGLVVVVVCLI
jgi:hypothetical protein